MNKIEIVLLLVSISTSAYYYIRTSIRKRINKAAEERSQGCTCGCNEVINKLEDVLFANRWYKVNCWKRINQ